MNNEEKQEATDQPTEDQTPRDAVVAEQQGNQALSEGEDAPQSGETEPEAPSEDATAEDATAPEEEAPADAPADDPGTGFGPNSRFTPRGERR